MQRRPSVSQYRLCLGSWPCCPSRLEVREQCACSQHGMFYGLPCEAGRSGGGIPRLHSSGILPSRVLEPKELACSAVSWRS
eukprot:9273884-Lingulodinium_polyedra.AAC.1